MNDDQRIQRLEAQLALMARLMGGIEEETYESQNAGLAQALTDAVGALAPLKALLDDDNINDILINGPKRIFVERNGKLGAGTR